MQPRKAGSSRNANTIAKFACVTFILLFYLLYSTFHSATVRSKSTPVVARLDIQHRPKINSTYGARDDLKIKRIQRAMSGSWDNYWANAATHDEIKPITGGSRRTHNGWGVFLIDSASTLAVMGMAGELSSAVEFITSSVNFHNPIGLVDPFETTIRYLGGILSVVDLWDAGTLTGASYMMNKRAKLVKQATILADNLLAGYDSATGLPWPNVDFLKKIGTAREGDSVDTAPSVSPARAGTNLLENCVLSNLTANPKYCSAATKAWSSLVWSSYKPSIPGLIDGPIDVKTGAPIGRSAHWDRGHDSYYEYLLKASLLFPTSPYRKTYADRFLAATDALRWNLTSRSEPGANHLKSHLFLGRIEGQYSVNEQSHLSCFVPGQLMLASKALNRPDLMIMGKALLEGCRHVYSSTSTGLGPESWSWIPSTSDKKHAKLHFQGQTDLVTFAPTTAAQKEQVSERGFWISDPRYRLRPEYLESLFYAYRITGEARYRTWAWEAFQAIELHCKARFGYATVADVLAEDAASVQRIDEQESWWVAETLKYAYLIFDDAERLPLEDWIFTTEGHPLKRRV